MADDEIEYLQNKPRSEWTIDDWKSWSAFCEDLAGESKSGYLDILKENLRLKIQLTKLEDFISKKYGLPKYVKSKGLLTAPRGRPIKLTQKKLISEFVRQSRLINRSWKDIGDIISRYNDENGTEYPITERYLREISKSAD